ncbi:hypothetical protein [Gemmatirosa kalamazoonensis]|uniref:hypothetical protein n=1 Tax=Gemmatirosa kalamazoonensis TaxID=861299 RepID=UPI0011DCC075|nr:hypothetical protein [Gemmatirosa kalamazoonensis]
MRAPRHLLAAIALALGASRASAQGATPGLRAGVSVTPDTVAVGDPFVVKVRVQAAAGTVVTFPAPPDTSGPVQARDPRRVDSVRAPAGEIDVVATYRVSAWDVGPLPLGLADVVVRDAAGERRVPLGAYRVYVRSVLPTDSALRVPKPARAPLPDAPSVLLQWWPWILAAAIVLALIGWLVSRWLQKRRSRRGVDDPYGHAVREFARLEKLGLVEAGEHGRLVALAADVVRDYLAARLPDAARSLTSTEVQRALGGREEVPHERLAALLEFADLVKFAAVRIGPDAARQAFAEARGVVDDVERGVKAREEREAAEAEARARRASDEQRRYEEERRRASRRDAA